MGGFVLQLGESGSAVWEMFSSVSNMRTNGSNQSRVINHEIKNRELECQGLAWSSVGLTQVMRKSRLGTQPRHSGKGFSVVLHLPGH